MKKQKKIQSILCLTCCLILALTGCGSTVERTSSESTSVQTEQAVESEETQSAAEKRLLELGSGSMASKKEETVYASATADGSVYETRVETTLILPKDASEAAAILDTTMLQDLKNTEGGEEFVTLSNGDYLWENLGSDVKYEGISTQELPVRVTFLYELDGQPVQPEELAGKTGHIKIRVEYENLETRRIKVEDTTVDTVVPFTAVTAIILDEEKFSNIEVTNGEVSTLSDMKMVIGYAMPGVEEALDVEGLDLDDFDSFTIPSYIEMEADVTDFSLEFTETILTPGLMSELDLDVLSDLESSVDGMKDLGEASREITDGFEELNDGVDTIYDNFITYNNGVDSLHEGAVSMKSAMSKILNAGEQLESGASGIAGGLKSIEEALSASDEMSELDLSGLENLQTVLESMGSDVTSLMTVAGQMEESYTALVDYESRMEAYTSIVRSDAEQALNELEGIDLSEVPEEQRASIQSSLTNAEGQIQDILNTSMPEAPESSVDMQLLADSSADLTAQMETLATAAENLTAALTGISNLSDQMKELSEGIQTLRTYADQLTSGLTSYNQALDQLYDEGLVTMASGSGNLASAGDKFASALKELSKAVEEFRDGYQEFDEEGIQELADLGDSDAILLMRRIRALQEADASYDNFSGKFQEQESSVIFLIETDEIG